jgi:SPOR domain
MTDDAFPRSSRPIPPHGQDAADRREPASDPLMELARLIGQSDPFGAPPARGTESARTPELPTRGPMARPPSRDIPPRGIPPRTVREEEPRHEQEPRYEEEPAYEPRPARGHPFPWLQVPPEPAPAVSREPSYNDRSHEEPAYREAAYREPPPYSEPSLREAPAAHPSHGQPQSGGYERYEPTFGAPGRAEHQQAHHGYAAGAYPTVPDQQYAAEHYAAETEPGHEDHDPRRDDRQHYAADPEDGESKHGEHDPRYADPRYADPRYATAEHDPRYAAGGHDEHGEYDPRYAEEGEDGEHDPRYAAAAEEDQYDDEYEYADDEDGYADEAPKRRNLLKVALAGGLGLVVLGTAGAFGYRAMFHGGGSDGPPPLIRADNTPIKVVPTPTADASGKSINDRVGSGERMVSREEQPIDLRDARNANGALVAPVGTGGVVPYPTSPTTTSAAPASTSAATPTEPKRVRTVTIHADASGQPNPAPNAAAAPAMPPPRAAAPPAAGNAPLALTPQAPSTVAAVDTTRSAPAKAAPATGGWIVQLAAQKSEAEAQTSFRTAQAKYPALAGQEPLIRKKDYGEKGVFYATQVGPFPQREEANKLCETLKGAGGTCFIQKY